MLNLNLRSRMILAFLIVVISSITIATSFSLNYLYRVIYEQAKQKTESDLEVASLLISQKKQSLQLPARVLSKDMSFNRILAGRVGDLVKVRVKYFIRGLSKSDLSYMTVTDGNGIVLCRSEAVYSTGDDLSGDPAVKRALAGQEVTSFQMMGPDELWQEGLVSKPPLENSRERGLVIKAVVPVFAILEYDEEGEFQPPDRGRKVVGTITVGYLLNHDENLLKEMHRRTRGRASVYFPDALVKSSDPRWKVMPEKSLFERSGEWEGGVRILFYRSRGEVAGYFPLIDLDGRSMALLELRNSTAWIVRARAVSLRYYFLFICAGVAVAFVLGIMFTRRITEPIRVLTEGAEEIGRGNLAHRIDVAGGDEISRLADAFNDMSDRLFESMEQMRLSKRQIEDYSQRLKSAHSSLEMYSRELEKVNQELLVSNINLQKANEVKDTFLSTVSHELKTPLTTIIGYVSMILEGALGGLSEEQRQGLEVVLRRGRNLQSLISDLLGLSRIDAGRLELHRGYVDLAKELRGIEEVFSERLKESELSLDLGVDDHIPHVYADRDRINQVIFNLVGNAIKFTPAGGRITLGAAYNGETNEIRVTVADTGIGIAESELGHIFERFYQVDRHDGREYAGTGLGLAIAREIVELHGGRIWAESEPGKSSVFIFTIPLSQDRTPQDD
jgi:signal transduction histidine kinase